jgi:hypothetical protein
MARGAERYGRDAWGMRETESVGFAPDAFVGAPDDCVV